MLSIVFDGSKVLVWRPSYPYGFDGAIHTTVKPYQDLLGHHLIIPAALAFARTVSCSSGRIVRNGLLITFVE